MNDDWKLITIKYANKCCICHDIIEAGSNELWKKGEGVKHQSCVGLVKQEVTKQILLEKNWHDSKVYPYGTIISKCQFCGISLSHSKDSYINLDRYCCSTCFGIY